MTHQKIAVLDFGGQYAHLIANRVRRLGVYSEILEADTPASQLSEYKGIILSGGPDSVYGQDSPKCDKGIYELGIPILAICYGHQLMQLQLGGKVANGLTKEYGPARIAADTSSSLFKGLSESSRVWMSHFDVVSQLAPGFQTIASTPDCEVAAVGNEEKKFYGIQFHAEVTHSEQGMRMIDNFLTVCAVSRDWSMSQFIEEEIEAIKRKIGDKKVFLLVSGGVDSSVCFALLEKALGKERVYGMLVDTGLMRLDEAAKVKQALAEAGFENLHVADKKDQFLSALAGITDPEAKRKVIGEMFLTVKDEIAKQLGLDGPEWVMGQGTIYPDTIETGGTKNAHTIKTHHNRVDAVQKLIEQGKVIEPIAQLYKDEVRELGRQLGLPEALIARQPFPGPGLGVRILCASQAQAERSGEVSFADTQLTAMAKELLADESAQVKVLPCSSVGVQGDERTYRHPAAIFTSCRSWEKLEALSTYITNRFDHVNRVVLALSGQADDFQLYPLDIAPSRVTLLQKVDAAVTGIMQNAPEDYGIWQFPVVLVPTSPSANQESVVLRPIVSTEAMTASVARIDWSVVDQLTQAIASQSSISHVFYDLTPKPPGTIEWE